MLRITAPRVSVAETTIGPIPFGSICLSMILRELMPKHLAASTYSIFLRVSTLERTILANLGICPIARARTSFHTPFPNAVIIAIARRAEGTLISISTTRIRRVSTLPPKKPAVPPIRAPHTKAIPMMIIEIKN